MTQDLVIDLAIRYGFQVLGAVAILAVGAILGRRLDQLVVRSEPSEVGEQ